MCMFMTELNINPPMEEFRTYENDKKRAMGLRPMYQPKGLRRNPLTSSLNCVIMITWFVGISHGLNTSALA